MSKIPERFFTVTDRIKQYLQLFPNGTFIEASDYILSKFNIIIKRSTFYRIRSERNLGHIDKHSKQDCYKDIVELTREYGTGVLEDLERLLNDYVSQTITEQIHVLRYNMKLKS